MVVSFYLNKQGTTSVAFSGEKDSMNVLFSLFTLQALVPNPVNFGTIYHNTLLGELFKTVRSHLSHLGYVR